VDAAAPHDLTADRDFEVGRCLRFLAGARRVLGVVEHASVDPELG